MTDIRHIDQIRLAPTCLQCAAIKSTCVKFHQQTDPEQLMQIQNIYFIGLKMSPNVAKIKIPSLQGHTGNNESIQELIFNEKLHITN